MRYFLLFASFLLSTMMIGQNIKINGKVLDSESNQAVPYANVVLKHADGKEQISTTNDIGEFVIEKVSTGNYTVFVSYLGYETLTIPNIEITSNKNSHNLGSLSIKLKSINLNDVEVVGTTNTAVSKIDKKIYKASDFETSKDGNATDVLSKLPSVSVSAEGEVSVRGSSGFAVYLNGKPTQMDPSVLLGQISASSIDKIEVITVPGAQYDAQGKGGIINITTKKQLQNGLSIAATGMIGGAPWANVTDQYSDYELNDNRVSSSINITYNKDKLSLYGGLNYSYKNLNGSRVGDARILQTDNSYYHMVASGQRPEWFENYSGTVGFDYLLSKKSTLSASYYRGNRTEGRSAFYIYNNFYADENKNPISGIDPQNHYIYNPNTDNRYGIFNLTTVDYALKISENQSLKASFIYEYSDLSRKLDNENYAFDNNTNEVGEKLLHYKQADETPLDGYRLSIDYTKKLGNGKSLAVGIQPQYIYNPGSFTYDTLNIESNTWGSYKKLENEVLMTRGVYAGYANYSGETGNLAFSFGLRTEYTDQEMTIENPDYFSIFDTPKSDNFKVNQLDWFPSMNLKQTLTEKDKLALSASRRINRPPTKDMAPFLYRRHYEVYLVGDPNLKPEYINSIELGYERALGKHNIIFTSFYRGVENAIFRVNTVYQEENVLIRSNTNSGNSTSVGGELIANLQPSSKFNAMFGAMLYYYNVQGEAFGYEENNSSTNWNLKGNANYSIFKNLKLSADFNVKSATVTAQGRNGMTYIANAALNYTPGKLKAWSFSAKCLDILSSNNYTLDTRAYNEYSVQTFYQETEYFLNGPVVELGVSYFFNKSDKNKQKSVTTFGNEQF